MPLGRVFDYEPSSECPFRLILLASTLHHKEILSESAKKGIIRSAMEEAIHTAGQYDAQRVATAVLKGGWRFSRTEDAFIAMSEGCDRALQKWPVIHLDIYVYDQGDYDNISSLARSIGWR